MRLREEGKKRNSVILWEEGRERDVPGPEELRAQSPMTVLGSDIECLRMGHLKPGFSLLGEGVGQDPIVSNEDCPQ